LRFTQKPVMANPVCSPETPDKENQGPRARLFNHFNVINSQ
jgi:hypothetical protein